jgi:5-methylcytosine-specific restriction endonuclease McrA
MVDSNIPTKVCTKCHEEKPTEDFNRWSGSRDGRFPWCRECNCVYQRERAAAKRAARLPKPPVVIPETKPCTRCGQEKALTDFFAKPGGKFGRDSWCRECRGTYGRDFYHTNVEMIRVRNQQNYARNAERERQRAANRRAVNPDYWQNLSDEERLWHREATARSRAKARGVAVEMVDFAAVLARDGYHCHICEQPITPQEIAAVEFDHVLPIDRGGAHTADNIKVAHVFCNQSKGQKPIEELRARRSRCAS